MNERATVLCVDDEPHVLEGLQRVLRPHFAVSVSSSGPLALARVKAGEEFDILLSDMRMPEMSGAQLLYEFKSQAPDTVRILLTGQADLESAIAAVNEGHIFRFLMKPCAPSTLTNTLRAAALQRRLLCAERVLLQQTLVGSVRALSEVLALTHPDAFGSNARQHERARLVAAKLGVADAWHVEVASMLAAIRYALLPGEVIDKLAAGAALDDAEREMVARVPSVVESVLANIPRLELVREALKHADPDEQRRASKASNLGTPIGARVLTAILDLGRAESRLGDTRAALEEIGARREFYGGNVYDAVVAVCTPQPSTLRGLNLEELRVGMLLLEPVKTETGMVVIPRGERVSAQLLERLKNFSTKFRLRQPIRCEVPSV